MIGSYKPLPSDAVWNSLTKIISSGQYVNGQFSKGLKAKLDEIYKAETTLTCNGTQALASIFLVLAKVKRIAGRGEKLNVAVPANYHYADIACLKNCNIFFVDVDHYGMMEFEKLEAVSKSVTLDAVLYIALGGMRIKAYDELLFFCRRQKIWMVVDGCQAFNVKYECDFSTLSFFPTKVLWGSSGGAIISNVGMGLDCKDAREPLCFHKFVNLGYEDGTNARMDDVQAAIVYGNLVHRFQAWDERRKEIARVYNDVVYDKWDKYLEWSYVHGDVEDTNFYKYFMIFQDVERAEKLNDFLAKKDVFLPELQFPYRFSDVGKFEGAYKFFKGQVCLPCHQYMTDDEVNYVKEILSQGV